MGEWLETWSPQSFSHCGRQDPCKQLYFLQPNLPFENEFLLAQNITTRWLQQQNQKAMTLNIIWCKHKTHLKYCNLFTPKGTTGLQVEQMCSILRQNTHATFVHRLHWRTRHDPHANSVHQDSHLFAAFDFLTVGTSGMAQDKAALYCNLMLIFMWLSNACAHSVQKAEVVLYSGLKELLQYTRSTQTNIHIESKACVHIIFGSESFLFDCTAPIHFESQVKASVNNSKQQPIGLARNSEVVHGFPTGTMEVVMAEYVAFRLLC